MHISFGMPLISAEHEPHLPALQFQRHGEVVGLRRPGSRARRRARPCPRRRLGRVVANSPVAVVAAPDLETCVRRVRRRRPALLRRGVRVDGMCRRPSSEWRSLLHLLDDLPSARSGIGGIGSRASCIAPFAPLRTTMLNVAERRILVGIVVAEVAAAALLPLERRPRDRLGHGQQVAAGRARCASPDCTRGCPARRPSRARSFSVVDARRAPAPSRPRARTMPTSPASSSCSASCT